MKLGSFIILKNIKNMLIKNNFLGNKKHMKKTHDNK
jgi:hypothetical protein